MRATMEQKTFMLPDEIGKIEIRQITGASKSKIDAIIRGEYNFPPRKLFVNRYAVFDRASFYEWLENNDINQIKIVAYKGRKVEPITDGFNAMARAFICAKPLHNNCRVAHEGGGW